MAIDSTDSMRCPICHKLYLVEELQPGEGHRFVDPSCSGKYYQSSYAYCLCGNPIALAFNPGDGTGFVPNDGVEVIQVKLKLE